MNLNIADDTLTLTLTGDDIAILFELTELFIQSFVCDNLALEDIFSNLESDQIDIDGILDLLSDISDCNAQG